EARIRSHVYTYALWQQATSQDPRIGASHVPESRLAKPKRDKDSTKPQSATHRRRSPRICVGSQYSSRLKIRFFFIPNPFLFYPRIGVEAHTSHVPESRLAKPKRDQDSPKPQSVTHRRRSLRICVGSQ
ncbi:hypothetical protein PIB30_070674, partial [Stylosanthes scabra]|nr:hypothetical protein [Stylosanthes scabra]